MSKVIAAVWEAIKVALIIALDKGIAVVKEPVIA